MMQVVILAGGLGTRMRGEFPDVPKSLIPVGGRPFIEHQFELLGRSGMRRVLLCVGDGAEKIVRHVGDGGRWGLQVSYSHEDPESLLGTGGALVNALPLLDDEFLVMYGDSYLPTDYRAVAAAFGRGDFPAMMCVYHNRGRWDPSNTRIAGGRVVFYSKQAPPESVEYIDYGLSAYRKYVIERYRRGPFPLDLARVQSDLVEAGEMGAYEVEERFFEIGKPAGRLELEAYLRARPRDGARKETLE